MENQFNVGGKSLRRSQIAVDHGNVSAEVKIFQFISIPDQGMHVVCFVLKQFPYQVAADKASAAGY